MEAKKSKIFKEIMQNSESKKSFLKSLSNPTNFPYFFHLGKQYKLKSVKK